MAACQLQCNSDLSLTERRTFSLFALYPEITFDPEECRAPVSCIGWKQTAAQLDSSPTSASEEVGQSPVSNTTAQTTPLRPVYLTQDQGRDDTDTVADYLRLVQVADLSEECRLCFTSLAQSIGSISTGLAPSTSGRYRINNTYFMDQCSVLLREAEMLSARTQDQIQVVTRLVSLVLFQAMPTEDTLWSVYRQRAQLVIRLTTLPCLSEFRLIRRLALLYNAILYNPVQILHDDGELEPETIRMANRIYDSLFSWVRYYRQWCKVMRDMKEKFMTPLLTRILASEAIVAEVKSMQTAKRKAAAAIEGPVGPSMLMIDERVIKALNLSARRKEAVSVKKKTRSRREKTI